MLAMTHVTGKMRLEVVQGDDDDDEDDVGNDACDEEDHGWRWCKVVMATRKMMLAMTHMTGKMRLKVVQGCDGDEEGDVGNDACDGEDEAGVGARWG